ncbi:MAG: NTP transferase domain-containing protein, partial [Lentisphaeria bacterium]|nr:NTP transferase domain-containing protein [Lentisphaeria bacterium]
MKSLIVIPARYGSKRFPGKPLAELAGKAILQRVWDIAAAVCAGRKDCEAVVATEEPESPGEGSALIIDYCREHGIPVEVTPSSCRSGSDRVWAVAAARQEKPEVLLNLQGDNPLCPPQFLHALLDAFDAHRETMVATAYTRLDWAALNALKEAKKSSPFSGTTAIIGSDGNAKWFSKNIIPAIRGEEKLMAQNPLSPVCRHIGLYAYKFAALAFFSQSPLGEYEKMEQLE